MNTKFREPFSGFSHLFGVIISVLGLVTLIYRQLILDNYSAYSLLSSIIFGVSLILLYSASTIYHLTISKDSVIKFLRKLDHSMIFVLIAGTYTPICVILLEGATRYTMLTIIWGIALIGVIFKTLWITCPSWLSSTIYVIMGWSAVFIMSPLSKVVPLKGLLLLIIGGVLYTIGAVIYCLEKNGVKRKFGAHEIFHIFVLMGSFTHYVFIYKYVFHL